MSYKDMGVKLIGWMLRFQGRDDAAEFERRSPVGQGSTKGGQREGQEQWRGNRKRKKAPEGYGTVLRNAPTHFQEPAHKKHSVICIMLYI